MSRHGADEIAIMRVPRPRSGHSAELRQTAAGNAVRGDLLQLTVRGLISVKRQLTVRDLNPISFRVSNTALKSPWRAYPFLNSVCIKIREKV